MSSEKASESTQNTIQRPEHSCSRDYKPWIWTLVVMAIITVIWALYEGSQQEGYVNNFLTKGQKAKNMGVPTVPVALPVAGNPFAMQAAQAPGAVGDVQTSYHSIIDAVRPSVVSIDAAMRNTPNAANQGVIEPFPNDVPFNKIGSGVIIDPRGYVLSSYHVIAGAEALKATVYGPGGAREYPLKMVKGDLRTDMALLRIQGGGSFPHATLGNSDAARTGDMVLTIGSPFGFEQTVTSGMISSRNRTLQVGDTVYENLIQTDSAINRGSSGGPMLNVRGEVIGINTAIFAPTGVFNGVGFAIPINRAAELVGGVLDFNNTAPGAVGGQLVAWTSQGRQVGNAYRLPNGQMVTPPHTPRGSCVDCHPQLFEQQAAQRGTVPVNVDPFMQQQMRPGTAVNVDPFFQQQTRPGTAVNVDPFFQQQTRPGTAVNVDPFFQQQTRPGTAVNVDPFFQQQTRPGTAVNVDPLLQQQMEAGMAVNVDPLLQQQMEAGMAVNVDPLLQQQNGLHIGAGAGRSRGLFGRTNGGPITGNGQFTAAGQQLIYSEPLMGVGIMDVNDVVSRQAGMLHPEGVLVTAALQGGPAERAGIQRGDIIVRIAGRKVLNIDNLNKLISSQSLGRKFELVYLRNGSRRTATVKTALARQNKQAANAQQPVGIYQWPLGASITPIIPAFTTITKTGVYVQKSGGILAANGLKNGDIIKGINGAQVEDIESFIKQTKLVDTKRGFVLDVIRSGNSIYLTVKG